jgi:hypothetical protein
MTPEKPVELPYKDLPDLNETFADQVRVIHFDGQTLRIELAVSRPLMTGQNQVAMTQYPSVRLVLTPFAAVNLRDGLVNILSQMEASGILKRVASEPTTKQ